ncbi:MAG: hypothetical protein CVU05_08220 [Bacteroidetes bacterium HGW-Bacteroidetes-21]|jgi:hypothetical protein|nr:MAG: hypothetical protein CVU05_08220 [Bacteroidetes bacterium HGW-Bacteroidetes-21]
MKDLLQNKIMNLTTYIKNVVNVDVDVTKVSNENLRKLPFVISGMYAFCFAKFFDKPITLMFVNQGETTVDRIRNHTIIVQDAWNKTVVVVFDNMESYTRKRLIEKKVPFIIPGKQMYLPDLLIDLKEYATAKPEQTGVIQPAAQFLLIYHLLSGHTENMNMKTVAENLSLMPMTITRAAYNLYNTGLCEIIGTKDKFIVFDEDKRRLWDKALPLLTSPIKKVNYYTGWIKEKQLRRSNFNALAHYTDINDDPIEYYATTSKIFKHLEGVNFKRTGKIVGNICVEEWKYNPAILAKNSEYVDPLSLYLCFKEDKDERTEAAMEQLIEDLKW